MSEKFEATDEGVPTEDPVRHSRLLLVVTADNRRSCHSVVVVNTGDW